MYVKYSEYGERYLPHKDFLHLCSDLGIEELLGRVDEKWLAFLEKNKILLPEYKLIKPSWYLNFILKYDHSKLEKIKSKRWKHLDILFKKISGWQLNYSLFHPFDKNKIKSEYLQIPKISGYSKWKDYYKKPAPEGRYYSIEKDIYYYPYWRAYQLYEINKACIKKYVINVFDEDVYNDYKELRKIPYSKVKSWSVPFHPDLYRKEIFSEDHNFDMLSFYIQTVRRVESVPMHLFLKAHSDDQEEREKYYDLAKKRKQRIANITISKYKLTPERLIQFLKYLCEKYFRYEDKELLKLSYMLRVDIIYLRNLLQDGFNLSNTTIKSMLGEIPFKHHINPLRYIFLGKLAEARQDSFRMFKDFIERTFVINKIEIQSEEFEDFLSFLDENDMDTIYVTIRDYYYLPSDYRKYRNPISNLATLVVYFESYLRSLILFKFGSEGDDWLKGDDKNQKKSLKHFINKLLFEEKWLDKLNSYWNDKLGKVTKYDINDLEKEILETQFHINEQWNELIKIFALIGAIRNYIAHDFFQFYKSIKHYDIYFRFIISAFWYCWKQTKSNEDNNSKQNPIISA